jgi:hypothetical protein
MFHFIRSILLTSVLFAPVCTSARGDFISLTWTGTTLSDSQDNLGLFGPVGAIIPAGTIYSSNYVYDTSISFIENQTNSTQEVNGGSFYNPARPSPLVGNCSFTINGQTANLNGQYYGVYFRQSGQGISRISTDAIAEIGGSPLFDGQVFQRASRNDNLYGLPLNMTGFFQFGAGDSTDGFFSYRTRDANGNFIAVTSFNLVPSSLTISAIPEPTSVVLTSLAGVLLALNRRKR